MRCVINLVIVMVALFSATITSASTVNEKDSVWLCAYCSENGNGGMKLAWSDNQKDWHRIGDGYQFVNSDFGPWGSHKKMFDVKLYRTTSGWRALWFVSDKRETVACADSPDLMRWAPQKYAKKGEDAGFMQNIVTSSRQSEFVLDGKNRKGGFLRVPVALKNQLISFVKNRARIHSANNELMKDDSARFAGLKEVNATIYPSERNGGSKQISDNLIGIFFEDISYAADGGLYAELIQNRDFEYSPEDCGVKGWGPSFAWNLREGDRDVDLTLSTENPLHENNRHYLSFRNSGNLILSNAGFDGISLKKGAEYRFSMYARLAAGAKRTKLKINLYNSNGKGIAKGDITVDGHEWRRYDITLKSAADASGCTLRISIPSKSNLDVDMISLFPSDTYKGRENGLRRDLAETLEALSPKFVRFPGGCVAHGDGIDNIYDWKGSVGPLYARKPLRNMWGYHQTRGLGYHEYFLLCEDLKAEPLPVLAAGVPCQNSGRASHYTKDEITHDGQQCGIPMEDMDKYIRDVLDLIEYANGDINTEWGAKRAEAGHPEPFDLKYIGIGNEDMITEVFEERFKLINDAVKKRYPEITVVGTVGPFYEGADYRRGWEFAKEENVDMVDEHYYVSPGWFLNNRNFYDEYDRNGPKVYLGEYASHMPGRESNLEAALTIALYLADVERNGDVVSMTSYAPLFAKDKHVNWRPDMIYFNNDSIRLTPDYYVQKMYGRNSGSEYLMSDVLLDNNDINVSRRIGHSMVRDSKTGDYIIKLANLLPVEVRVNEFLGALGIKDTQGEMETLSGEPSELNTKPESGYVNIVEGTLELSLKPYSFTVIRIHDR